MATIGLLFFARIQNTNPKTTDCDKFHFSVDILELSSELSKVLSTGDEVTDRDAGVTSSMTWSSDWIGDVMSTSSVLLILSKALPNDDADDFL